LRAPHTSTGVEEASMEGAIVTPLMSPVRAEGPTGRGRGGGGKSPVATEHLYSRHHPHLVLIQMTH
jgi:hypothetical protein